MSAVARCTPCRMHESLALLAVRLACPQVVRATLDHPYGREALLLTRALTSLELDEKK